MGSVRKSDYVMHPPSGSSLPGTSVPNPYISYPPSDIRKFMETETDKKEFDLMRSALKQWERIYVYPGYPWRKASDNLRILAVKIAEYPGHPENVPYYYDDEVPEGLESILEGLRGIQDNEDQIKFDYNRQGERPSVDMDTSKGDFLTPKEPVFQDSVKTKGDGANPEGMEDDIAPPTGGDIDQWPDMLAKIKAGNMIKAENCDIYETLCKNIGDLKNAEETDYCGLDAFLAPPDDKKVALSNNKRIASLGDLSDFLRLSKDTLVHKSEKDLWRISEDKKGQVIIERLFNPETKEPLKV